MYTQEINVQNEVGLHARPATYFIQKANEFKRRKSAGSTPRVCWAYCPWVL